VIFINKWGVICDEKTYKYNIIYSQILFTNIMEKHIENVNKNVWKTKHMFIFSDF